MTLGFRGGSTTLAAKARMSGNDPPMIRIAASAAVSLERKVEMTDSGSGSNMGLWPSRKTEHYAHVGDLLR